MEIWSQVFKSISADSYLQCVGQLCHAQWEINNVFTISHTLPDKVKNYKMEVK